MHATPRPLKLGGRLNENKEGNAWIVPVFVDDSPNCIYAQAMHEDRDKARERAALIVKAVNTHERAKELLKAAYCQVDEGGALEKAIKALLTDMEG